MAPKVEGAWNLHALLEGHPEVELVLFSSVASLLGLAGQGNYAAGNAFLDVLAAYHRARGGRATAINWGPWSGIGLAAATSLRGKRLAAGGLRSLSPAQGLAALERILDQPPTQVAVMPLDWAAYAEANPVSARSPFLRALGTVAAPETSSPERSARDALLAVDAGPRRRAAMESFLKEQVARVLRQAASRIDATKPFRSLGLDSLMGLELRNRLEAAFAVQLPATMVWNYPTVKVLAPHLATILGISLDAPQGVDAGGVASPPADELEAILREIERLSSDEARRLLEQDDAKGTLK
jgi:acyl carrier protein